MIDTKESYKLSVNIQYLNFKVKNPLKVNF